MKGLRAGFVASLLMLPAAFLAFSALAISLLEPRSAGAEGGDEFECGRRLVEGALDHVPLLDSVRVVLATDEEWRREVSDPESVVARRVVLDAAALFRGLGIHLLTVRTVAWDSPDDAGTIRDTWLASQAEIPLSPGDVVVVLTAQSRSNTRDGYAQVGGSYVAVAHHPDHPDRDALVLAHELSHLFGAHHGCDVEGREGLMAAEGFDQDLVCPCTRKILELNSTRFHEVDG